MELILNDLSCITAADRLTARDWIHTFLRTVRAAFATGISRSLRAKEDFQNWPLAPDYPFQKWLNDGEVDRETRLYFLSLTTKSPFWVDLPQLEDQVLACEFYFEKREAIGLGVAFLMDGLAISFCSEFTWRNNLLNIEVRALNEAQQIEEAFEQVVHVSQPDHVRFHQPWIQQQISQAVETAHDLWQNRATLFPHLDICARVEAQILALHPVLFKSVKNRLFELENYCRNWADGRFQPDLLPSKTTPESQITLVQYAFERTFLCPDGLERLFSWHQRMTPGANRLYFYPVPETRRMFIGHIGEHIATALYR